MAIVLLAALAIAIVSAQPIIVTADHAALEAMKQIRTPARDDLAIALTQLGDPDVAWPVSIAMVLWLATLGRSPQAAIFYAVTVGGAAALNSLIKVLFTRARPNTFDYEGFTAFSFPSGHATSNIVLYGTLAILITREIAPRHRAPFAALLVAFGALIGLSRIYLGAHWMSDVAGSALLATAILSVAAYWYASAPRPQVSPARLSTVAVISLIIFGGANILRNHQADAARYAVEQAAAAPHTQRGGNDDDNRTYRQIGTPRANPPG